MGLQGDRKEEVWADGKKNDKKKLIRRWNGSLYYRQSQSVGRRGPERGRVEPQGVRRTANGEVVGKWAFKDRGR